MASISYNFRNYLPKPQTGNGSRVVYSPDFPAFSVADVVVYVNGTATTTGVSITLSSYGAIPVVQFTTAPTSTQEVLVTLDGLVGNVADTRLEDTRYSGETYTQLFERALAFSAVEANRISRGLDPVFTDTSPYKYIQRIDINPAASSTQRLGPLAFTNVTSRGVTRRVPTIAADDYVVQLISKTNSLGDVDAGKAFVTSFSGDMLGTINQLVTAYFWFEFTHHFSDVSSRADQVNYRVVATTSILNDIFNVNLNAFNSDPILPVGTPGLDVVAPISARLIIQVGDPQNLFTARASDAPGAEMTALTFENCAVNFTQLADKRGPAGPRGPIGPAGPGGEAAAVNHDTTLTGTGAADNLLRVANPFTDADETKLDGIAAGATVGATAAELAAIALNTAKTGITQSQADAIALNTSKIGLTDGSVTTDRIGIRAVTTTRIADNNITSNLIATDAVGLRALGTANAGAQGQILARGGGSEIEWIAPPQNESTDDFINAVINSSDQLLMGRRNGNNVVVQLPRNQFVAANLSGQVLTLTRRDGTSEDITIPAGGGGLATVISDATLTGDGSSGTPLSVANPFTDDDETKLDGIETSATADQSNTEIRDSLQSLTGANRLDAAAIRNLPQPGDGGLAAVSTDGTLAGLGTGNDVLRVTTPFTTAEKTKLGNIETAATIDQTPTEIVTGLETLTGDNRLNASAVRDLPSSDSLQFSTAESSWGVDLNLFIPATAGTYRYLVVNPTNGPTGVGGNVVVEVIRYGSNDLIQRILQSNLIHARGGRGSYTTNWVEFGTAEVFHDTTLFGMGTLANPLTVGTPYSQQEKNKLAGIAEGATVGATTFQGQLIASHSNQLSTIQTQQNTNTAAIALNTDKRTYPQADETKLGNVEANATTDQTPAELVTALETLNGDNRLDAAHIRNLPEPADGGLTAVAHDATLTGLGTNADQLRVTTPFTTALANTIANNGSAITGITTQVQSNTTAIALNTAKRSYPSGDETKLATIAANATVGATTDQANAIAANTLKTGITQAQSSAIALNTAKTGITQIQANAIAANTNKVGLTDGSVTTARLADDAVDASKLSAPAGTSGQVLTRGSGNALAWGTVATPGSILATDGQFSTGTSTTLAPNVAQVSRALDAVVPILSQWNGSTNPATEVQVGPLPTVTAGSSNPSPYNQLAGRFEISGNGLGINFQSRLEWRNDLIDWKRTAFCYDTEQVAGNWQLITYFGATASPNNINQNSANGGFGIGIFRPTSNSGNNYLFALTPYSGSGVRGELTPTSYHNGAVAPTNSNIGTDLGGFGGFVITETTPRMRVLVLRNERSVKVFVNRILRAEFTLSAPQNNRVTGNRYGFFGDGGNNKLVYLYGLAIGNPPLNLLDENCSVLEQLETDSVTALNILKNSTLTGTGAGSTQLGVANDSIGVPQLDIVGTPSVDNIISYNNNARLEWIAPPSTTPPAGSVGTSQLADLAVTEPKIGNLAVTTAKIQNDAVNAAKIANLAVTNAKVADDAITGTKIANNAVGQSELAAGAVGTPQVIDKNITQAKLADNINQSSFQFVAAVSGSFTGFSNGTGTAFGTVENQLAGVASIFHGSSTSSLTQVQNRIGVTFTSATEAAKYNAIQVDGTTFPLEDSGILGALVKRSVATVTAGTFPAFTSGNRYFIRMRLAAGSHLIGGRGIVVDGTTLVGEGTPEAPFMATSPRTLLGVALPDLPTS